ncbi:MAG: ComEA family DNA-binding protein [Candidatus Levybacteria bacterium]|nr:ComEA family DNA-binding protein [Candidatus Levybacteria bacterium]
MDSDLSKILFDFLKKHWLPLALALIGLIFFVYGLIAFISQPQSSNDIKFETNSTASTKDRENLITVDIEGAVVSPGVYKLKLGSIVQDALVLAAGLSGEADRDFVSKNINLATKLTDGQKIYIPKIGETVSASVLSSSTADTNANGPININTASEAQLDTLPGVGPVTAEKIINSRPYTRIEDLTSKSIVSQKVFNQIKDKITAF